MKMGQYKPTQGNTTTQVGMDKHNTLPENCEYVGAVLPLSLTTQTRPKELTINMKEQVINKQDLACTMGFRSEEHNFL